MRTIEEQLRDYKYKYSLARESEANFWKENKELQALLEKAKKVLEFYGHGNEIIWEGGDIVEATPYLNDDGELARELLPELERLTK